MVPPLSPFKQRMVTAIRWINVGVFGYIVYTIYGPKDGGKARSPGPAPENLVLKQAQVVFRHGARTPLFSLPVAPATEYEWSTCGFLAAADRVKTQVIGEGETAATGRRPPSAMDARQQGVVLKGGCHIGELTKVGKQQAVQLGSLLRSRYVDQLGLLRGDDARPDELLVRSTNVSRTVGTARGVLSGLLAKSFEGPVVVETVADESEILYPNPKACPRLAQLFRSAQTDLSDRDDFELKVTRQINKLMGRDNLDERVHMVGVRDVCVACIADGKEMPYGIDLALLADIEKLAVRHTERVITGSKDNPHETLRLAVGPLLKRMVSVIDAVADPEAAPAPPAKLVLYSAHDTTVLPLAKLAGAAKEPHWPPFCSHIAVEVFEDKTAPTKKYVQVLYQGQPAVVPGCPSNFCPVDDFKKAVAVYTDVDYAADCNTPAASTKPAGEGASF